jgi:hypothetical protein
MRTYAHAHATQELESPSRGPCARVSELRLCSVQSSMVRRERPQPHDFDSANSVRSSVEPRLASPRLASHTASAAVSIRAQFTRVRQRDCSGPTGDHFFSFSSWASETDDVSGLTVCTREAEYNPSPSEPTAVWQGMCSAQEATARLQCASRASIRCAAKERLGTRGEKRL